jgi:hypothetical protein
LLDLCNRNLVDVLQLVDICSPQVRSHYRHKPSFLPAYLKGRNDFEIVFITTTKFFILPSCRRLADPAGASPILDILSLPDEKLTGCTDYAGGR